MKIFERSKKKKLQKAYESKMQEAMNAQRGGDIQGYAELVAEAESLSTAIAALDPQRPEDARS